ncbi:MAG: hypothetical protein M3314_12220, partial [Actinomycetota bacterium]|nr:hypothetical protein [Actinomycetota bacterium]
MTFPDDDDLDDLDLVEDDGTRAALEAVRAAYVSDDLPRVGVQLAAVFTNGLPAHPGPIRPPAAERPAPAGTERRRRWLPSKALLAGLGATVVAVNLTAVGSAGWLPGPLQTSFEKVTRSIGVDVPAPRSVERQPAAGQDGPGRSGDRTRTGRPGDAGTPAPTGSPGGISQSPLSPGQAPPEDQTRRGQGGTPAPGPSVPGAAPGPATGPGPAGTPGTSNAVPPTVPCVTTTTAPPPPPPPGPTLPALPTAPTIKPPVAGDA